MVRLRVLFGAMLATGLMGLGVGIELGQRPPPIDKAKANSLPSPPCSVASPIIFDSDRAPLYPYRWCTVRVPLFKNAVAKREDELAAGLEMELTKAVVQTIDSETPYRIVTTSDADMELTGTVVRFDRTILAYDQLNEIREAEVDLEVEVSWRDFSTGKSMLASEDNSQSESVKLTSVGYYRPELGESIKHARKIAADKLTRQLLSLMEKQW